MVIDAAPNPALTAFPVTFTATAAPPAAQVRRVEWDFEGDGLYDVATGTELRAETIYADPGEYAPAVRVTDAAGRETVTTTRITVRRRPPAGPLGVLLNGGRRYTNDPNVRVGLIWPFYAVNAEISLDPAFTVSTVAPVRASLALDLDVTRPDGFPQTVYARFDGGPEVYSDEIVLDRTRPYVEVENVRRIRARRWRVRLFADDWESGIRSYQLVTDRFRPGTWRVYYSRPGITTTGSVAWVRVRDRAGNASRWQRVRLRHPQG